LFRSEAFQIEASNPRGGRLRPARRVVDAVELLDLFRSISVTARGAWGSAAIWSAWRPAPTVGYANDDVV